MPIEPVVPNPVTIRIFRHLQLILLILLGAVACGSAQATTYLGRTDASTATGQSLPVLAADPITGTVTKPARGGSFVDPVYGVTITRATQASDGTSTRMRHEYSRRQAFNSNNTRYIAQAGNGYWFLYDATAYAPLRLLTGLAGDAEPIWSATDPAALHYTSNYGGKVWWTKNVETNASTVLFDFTGKTPWPEATSYWTKAEGTTSADGKILALMATRYDSATQKNIIYGLVVLDTQAKAIVGTMDASAWGGAFPDHISTSASGKYVVPSWAYQPTLGTRACPVANFVYSACKPLHTKSEHSDLAYGPNGEDLYVLADYDVGKIRAVNMDTLASFDITNLYPRSGSSYSVHISGQAFDKPGWLVISSYADFANYGSTSLDPILQKEHRKVYLAELVPNGQQFSIAHIRASGTGYYDEPQATVSRDLSRVMYATNLGSGVSDSYVVALASPAPPPPSCARAAPTVALIGPSDPVAAGTTVSYAIEVTNNDSSGCASTSFSLARSVPGGWTGALSVTSMSLSAGAQANATLSVTSTGTASAATYGIGVATGSAVGSIHTANASDIYVVAPPSPPPLAPLPPPSICTRAAPTVSLTGSSSSVAAGTKKSYAIKVINNDSSACPSTSFSMARSVPRGWSGTLSVVNISLSPGAQANATLRVTSKRTASAATYGIGVATGSAVGNTHTANASDIYVVAPPLPSGDPIPTKSNSVAYDFDGDDKSDVLWRNNSSGRNVIWRSAVDSSKQSVERVSNLDWEIAGAGDFDRDGRADILWRNRTNGRNVIWRAGNADAPQAVTNVGTMSWKIMGVGDFNGDGTSDVLWRNVKTGRNVIWRAADSSDAQAVPSVTNVSWHVAGVGDFDGDGRSDILWRNLTTGSNVIWRSANSAERMTVSGVLSQAWQIAGVGDFNGDGRSDMLWRNASTGLNVIWESGNSANRQSVARVANLKWMIVGIGDFNGDGKSDILWSNASTGENVIWRSGSYSNKQFVRGVTNFTWKIMNLNRAIE